MGIMVGWLFLTPQKHPRCYSCHPDVRTMCANAFGRVFDSISTHYVEKNPIYTRKNVKNGQNLRLFFAISRFLFRNRTIM